MGESDREFIETMRFVCQACGKECQLTNGRMKAENKKTFAVGRCSECARPQRFDVTDAWLEEEE